MVAPLYVVELVVNAVLAIILMVFSGLHIFSGHIVRMRQVNDVAHRRHWSVSTARIRLRSRFQVEVCGYPFRFGDVKWTVPRATFLAGGVCALRAIDPASAFGIWNLRQLITMDHVVASCIVWACLTQAYLTIDVAFRSGLKLGGRTPPVYQYVCGMLLGVTILLTLILAVLIEVDDQPREQSSVWVIWSMILELTILGIFVSAYFKLRTTVQLPDKIRQEMSESRALQNAAERTSSTLSDSIANSPSPVGSVHRAPSAVDAILQRFRRETSVFAIVILCFLPVQSILLARHLSREERKPVDKDNFNWLAPWPILFEFALCYVALWYVWLPVQWEECPCVGAAARIQKDSTSSALVRTATQRAVARGAVSVSSSSGAKHKLNLSYTNVFRHTRTRSAEKVLHLRLSSADIAEVMEEEETESTIVDDTVEEQIFSVDGTSTASNVNDLSMRTLSTDASHTNDQPASVIMGVVVEAEHSDEHADQVLQSVESVTVSGDMESLSATTPQQPVT